MLSKGIPSKVVVFIECILLSCCVKQISSSVFEKSISSPYFVDKTAMIKTLFENCKNTPNIMITCPKLFGKSLNLDMIKRFAEIEVDKNGIPVPKTETSNYKLFSNSSLKISQHKNLIDAHLAEYPVILFNLSLNEIQMENTTVERILQGLREALKTTTLKYEWLLNKLVEIQSNVENSKLEEQISFLQNVLDMNLNRDGITTSLLRLTEIVYQCFLKKVIVLIDDYDAVINKAILTPNLDSDAVIKVIKTMIGKLLEPFYPYVKFAVITGMNGILYHFHFLEMKTISHFLEMKTISHHRFSSSPLFSFYFGFTNEEVNLLLNRLNIGQKQSERDQIEKYYKGYTALGNLPVKTSTEKTIFNPYSITSYLADVVEHTGPSKDLNYWAETEPKARFLEKFVKASEFRKFMMELLHDKIIFVKHMHNYYENELVAFKNLVDRDFEDISSFDVLTFLAFMFEYGYLSYTRELNFYRIPNKEVARDIRKYLLLWYRNSVAITEEELSSIGDHLSDVINLEDAPDSKFNQFVQTSSRVFESMVSKHEELMPKRGGLQFELRSILYLAATGKERRAKVGEKLDSDFYENYPDTAKLVVINDEGTAMIILIMYEDSETLQEAMQYVKTNKLNLKQTIKCKKILSVNLLKDLTWETDYEVIFLQRETGW
ncbi:uncharacterized protein LOC135843421 [Planococcus citri]|uniref:uncharacterized protein LOC135843421 n=1 Tax=Planococcus citri TaxID=170843 RepID=UPI0031F9CE4D